MCRFLSALVLRSGEVYCDPQATDSHEDLIDSLNLVDNGCNFVRIEYFPDETFKIWTFKVDQNDTPDWFTPELIVRVKETLHEKIKRMIISQDRKMLLGGCWIITGRAKINKFINGRIFSIKDSANINRVYGSVRIDRVCGHASVNDVYGHASVNDVCDSAIINEVYGHASIDQVYGSAIINKVCGHAKIDHVRDSAIINEVCDSAKIGD